MPCWTIRTFCRALAFFSLKHQIRHVRQARIGEPLVCFPLSFQPGFEAPIWRGLAIGLQRERLPLPELAEEVGGTHGGVAEPKSLEVGTSKAQVKDVKGRKPLFFLNHVLADSTDCFIQKGHLGKSGKHVPWLRCLGFPCYLGEASVHCQGFRT